MNFLQRIKQTLDNRSIPQRGEFISILTRDLRELIHHYERLDAEYGINHIENDSHTLDEERLHIFLCAIWNSGKISQEAIKNTVIGTLAHLQAIEKYNRGLQRDVTEGTSNLKPIGLMSKIKDQKDARHD